MSVIRTLFLGTPHIAQKCLQSLHEDEHFEIVGVVSQPDRPSGRKMKLSPSAVSEYALNQELNLLRPESAKTQEFIDSVQKLGAEAAVVVAYGQILTQNFLDLYPQKVVNVHASLLPKWRGAAPIQRSIINGDSETGVCLQIMKQELDAGDVLNFRKIPLDSEIDALELHDQMIPLAADLLTIDFMDYLRGNLSGTPQDQAHVTFAPKIKKQESIIDWGQSSLNLHRLRRGLTLGPGVVSSLLNKRIKLHKTQVVNIDSKGVPGTIVMVNENSFLVQCGLGQLEVLEVQLESKRRQSVNEFLKGFHLKVGDRFDV